MKIEVFEREQNENIDWVRFIVDGIDIEMANAFRRVILTEVPTMAITEVLFIENDSVLYDEIIAHRLGLIPLTTDLKNYNLPDECSCGGEGCSLCQVGFTLEKVVEKGQPPQIVYSSDLKSNDPNVRPVSDKIIIAKLGENTSLILEAYAQLGRGKEHAKFQPVCGIGYSYFPKITIDNSKFENEEQIDEVISKDHCKIFEKVDGKLVLKDDYWKRADLINAYEKYAPKGAIIEEAVPNKFIFTVEGNMNMPLKEVLEVGCEIFLEILDEFEQFLNKSKIIEKYPESE